MLVRLLEELLDDPLALPDPLAEDVRHGDVEERHLVLVGDGPDEEGLPAARGAVEEDAPGRLQVDLLEEGLLLVRQDDHVPHPLDGLVEAADVRVADVGPLAQEEGLHLQVREHLQELEGGGQEGDLEAGLDGAQPPAVHLDDPLVHLPLDGDHRAAVEDLDDLRDDALVLPLPHLHDGVGLGVDPHVLAQLQLPLVHRPQGDLQELVGPGGDDLVRL